MCCTSVAARLHKDWQRLLRSSSEVEIERFCLLEHSTQINCKAMYTIVTGVQFDPST
jgi:hypothetical protein